MASRALPFVVAIALAAAGIALRTLFLDQVAHALDAARSSAIGDWLLGPSQPGTWLLAMGIALALLAALREPRAGGAARAFDRAGAAGLAAAALLALWTLFSLALHGKRHDVPGVGPVWALDDDMMITLRYAKNLAEGHGLVWNAGERVEGITNLLWALVLALPHLFLPAERVALAAIALDGALLLLAIGLTFKLARALGGSGAAAGLAALSLATNQAALHWAAAGSEVLLVAVLLLRVALAVARAGDAGSGLASPDAARELRRACLEGGLACLARPDALVAVAALLAAPIARRLAAAPTRSSGLKLLGALAALPLAALVFRLLYYGSPLPNTYDLKMTGWSERPLAGSSYVQRVLSQHGLCVALAAATLLAPRRGGAAALLAALFAHLAYVVWAGGDELPRQRFFVPVAPLCFALALVGAEKLARRLSGAAAAAAAQPGRPPPWLPWGCVALLGLGGALLPGVEDPRGESRARAERGNVLLGYAIRANTEPDAKVAHFWAGAAPYFSQRPGIDFLGKCDPVIARQQAKPGLLLPGHNKYDFDHSLALEPDVVVGGLPAVATRAQIGEYARTSPYRAFADLYRATGFAPRWVGARPEDVGVPERMPQLVGGAGTKLPKEYVEAIRGFHAVFVRAGSTKARPPAEWTAPGPGNLR